MKKLLLFTITLVLMTCTHVQAANVNTVKEAIVKRSIEMGVDPSITLSIAKSESGFKQEARSPRGAVGVFQIIPSTARRMGYNPYLLDDNIKCGIMYYKSMYKMFGSMELALAAYNAGPGTVKKYSAVPPFSETKRYVARIMSDYHYFKSHTDPAVLAVKNANNKTASVANSQVQKLNNNAQIAVSNAQQGKNTYLPNANNNAVSTVNSQVQKSINNAQIVASVPVSGVPQGKKAPLPMVKIEQSRNFNMELMKEIPMEVDVKSKSVAI